MAVVYRDLDKFKSKQDDKDFKKASFARTRCALSVFLLVITSLAAFSLPYNANAVNKGFPFYPGEKLTMRVNWGLIPAGEAVLEVLPDKFINGIYARHFLLTVKTTPFVDLFYKVRDRIEAYVDKDMTHSILYKKRKRGRKKKDIVVDFNWYKKEAQYASLSGKRKPIPILTGSFDPLSIFYAFRLQDLVEDKELECPVTDGKKCVMGKAKVIKREKINIAGRTFDTYLVEPDLKHLEGVFAKSKNAKLSIWVTADARKVPVKITSEVIVGSFVGELVSVENSGKIDLILKQQ